MAFKKFTPTEVLTNTMRTYPQCEFAIADGNVYHNSTPHQSGTRNETVRNVPFGFISLYEYNIDRPFIDLGRTVGSASIPDTGRIYPWISKDSANASFKTVGSTEYANEFAYGDILRSTYPLSASITREYTASAYTDTSIYNAHYVGLRNRLNFYGARSPYYKVSGAFGDKDNLPLNLISIPSIFYGSRIRPGTVSLKWYFTGSLISELRDTNQNGELVQVSSLDWDNTGDGSVAGVVLYEEGFVLLTGSWDLSVEQIYLRAPEAGDSSPAVDRAKWIYFGAGANDGVTQASAGSSFQSASFEMSFQGQMDTQVLTMFAHAKRGEVNYSNNPTYIKYGQEKLFLTSSTIYQENSELKLKNFTSSSFLGYDGPFKRQVFISKVAIYDGNYNLIGVATMGTPILKEESQDYTFKLKLDL